MLKESAMEAVRIRNEYDALDMQEGREGGTREYTDEQTKQSEVRLCELKR